MNKTIKTLLVAVMVVCLAVSAIALVACKDKTVTYTVNVTCNDAAALNNVKVQIKKTDGTLVKEATPIDGKATFDLEGADYTATLTGVAEGYEFADGKLTADAPSCTITVTKKQTAQPEPTGYTYTVSITYPAMMDVYGNTVNAQGPADGVTVSLYDGELEGDDDANLVGKTPAATKTTGADGKAIFQLEGELYTIVLSGLKPGYSVRYQLFHPVLTVSKDSPTYEVSFKDPARVGTSSSPLTFQLGENTIPLTEDVLMADDIWGGVIYKFTPSKTGNYTFTVTENGRVSDSNGKMQATSAKAGVISLEAGKEYVFTCSASTTTIVTYKVIISEGGEIEVPEDPAIEFEQLEGNHSIDIIEDSNGEAIPVWYKYTATETATYVISDPEKELWMEVHEGSTTGQSGPGFNGDDGDGTLTVNFEAGKTYYFWINTWSEKAGTVTFTITKQGTTPPQSPDGTATNPYIFETLEGSHSVEIVEGPKNDDEIVSGNVISVWYKYTATESGSYRIKDSSQKLWIVVCKGEPNKKGGEGVVINSLFGSDSPEDYIDVDIIAGATYYFWICNWDEEPITLNFTITKNDATSAGTQSADTNTNTIAIAEPAVIIGKNW